MANNKQHLFDNPANVQIVLYILYACCALLFILDFIIHRHKIHHWEGLLGFYSVYGFVGCVAIVLGSRWLRTIVKRDEDYYEPTDAGEGGGGGYVDK